MPLMVFARGATYANVALQVLDNVDLFLITVREPPFAVLPTSVKEGKSAIKGTPLLVKRWSSQCMKRELADC